MTQAQQPDARFPGRIGIALSGGGYRAAAFHLGALDYLARIECLPRLSMMSTVSGGSFTGAAYALALADGRDFESFFADFYRQMAALDLVRLGLDKLGAGCSTAPSGRRDLIASMAMVYAETFFKGPNGEPFLFEKILAMDTPLREVVLNTTEFCHGYAFRFQRSDNANARIGNFRFSIAPADAGKLRVSDIVAASSCFPGGFEPLNFPDDFHWAGGHVPETVREAVKTDKGASIALMDGGICDNQGIGSLLLADGRSAEQLDMFIISDVDQTPDHLYEMPAPGDGEGPTLGTINGLSWLLMLICMLSAGATGYRAFDLIRSGQFSFFWDFFLFAFPLLLSAGVGGALALVRWAIKEKVLPRIPQVGLLGWDDFKTLTFDQFLDMLFIRMGSLITLTSSVFMKRMRALGYDRIYKDPKYEGKLVSNLLGHLASGRKFENLPGVPAPSPGLRLVADAAARMPTTLWFDQPHQLPCLVASGQATLCYNLMKFIARNYGKETTAYPEPVKRLWGELTDDWIKLNDDPYVLLRERLPEQRLETVRSARARPF